MVKKMKKISLLKKLSPKTKAITTIFVLIIIGIIVGYISSIFSLQNIITELNNLPIQIDPIRIDRSVNYYTGALICLSVEITLLIGLLYVYFDSYRKTKTRFLISLNIFILALFIRSIISVISLQKIANDFIKVSPYVSKTFLTPGFSELNFIVYTFEIIALGILLYISME
jgi:hypothetical protein